MPVVISLGYEATPAEAAAKEGHAVSSKHEPASLRFGLEEVVCDGEYGKEWKEE